jgi:hypothetical protein
MWHSKTKCCIFNLSNCLTSFSFNKRTSVLLLGLGQWTSVDRQKILATADAIAEKVVQVKSLTDLVGVWATLIPRRQIA